MENRAFWIIVALLVLGIGFVFLQPTVEDHLAPTLTDAWVAIEVEGTGVARVGPVEIDEGQEFTLHAVVGGTKRNGETVYYTAAERLILGDQEIPAESVQPWDRNRPVKIRWYTLEGRLPFVNLANGGISAFRFESFLRSDWPLAWSIPGAIDSANDDHLQSEDTVPRPRLGTQRYRTQLELYRFEDDLLPTQVVRSWDVEDLKEKIESFPTVTIASMDGAREASRWLGLTQLVPPPEPSSELVRQIDELASHRIGFSRLTLLRDLARAAGTSFSELTWSTLDIAGEAGWQSEAEAGDLLRVGDRVVVLFRDLGQPGIVDYQDLCFDFVQGMETRALGAVFSGEGLTVEIARMASQGDAAAQRGTDSTTEAGSGES